MSRFIIIFNTLLASIVLISALGMSQLKDTLFQETLIREQVLMQSNTQTQKQEDGHIFPPCLLGYYKNDCIFESLPRSVGKNTRTRIVTPSSLNMLFLGDMMFDRYIRKEIDEEGFESILNGVKPLLQDEKYHYVIGNLEGTISDELPRPLDPNNTMFRFDPLITAGLRPFGIDIVSLANNHSQDFGRASYYETTEYLEAQDIEYFGDWRNEEHLSVVKSINGIEFALLGYHELSRRNYDLILQEIREFEKQDILTIVMAHWGQEYVLTAPAWIQNQAHQMIDVGADIIIGAHPHVVQPIEIYNNRVIFYSLGNFVFDQIAPHTREGLAVAVQVKKDDEYSIHFDLHGISLYGMKTALMDEEQTEILFTRLAQDSMVTDDLRTSIRQGNLMIDF